MSDNLRRYRAVRNALTQAYPTSPTGNFARHLQTLAALISGIVGSRCTFYRMRTSCSVIAPSRPWCSSWMAALWGVGAMPR